MAICISTLHEGLKHDFDALIDVRSPAEFAEDHIPGAINLPVLNDAERVEVGTLYKQSSPFDARKRGAALVFRNISGHLEGWLAQQDGNWRPLVYCWRGGQRSGSFAWALTQIGWRAETVAGGYKSWRRLVTAALYDRPLPHRLVQLGGYTGTAKTALLPRLAARGVQVIDLEDLAQHRGSLLGGRFEDQPSQKMFETRIVAAIDRCDPAQPVLVEAESSKIGALNLPPSLWAAMKAAPWIELTAPLGVRARYLNTAYDDILSDSGRLKTLLNPLRYHRGHVLVDRWLALINGGQRLDLCASLAKDHYDPAYESAKRSVAPDVLARFETDALDDQALNALSDRITERLQAMEI